jgi:hypothetical protein
MNGLLDVRFKLREIACGPLAPLDEPGFREALLRAGRIGKPCRACRGDGRSIIGCKWYQKVQIVMWAVSSVG